MAIEQIVAAYVRLQNRQALEDLMAHRQRLLADLKSRSGSVYDIMRAASRFPIKSTKAKSAPIGVVTLVLPKAEQAKPRKIQVT